MGNSVISCSSLPDVKDKVELNVCRNLLGDDFDIDLFNEHKSKKIGANFIYKSKLIELINTTDVFLSYCWGRDDEQRDNHERVARVNELLVQNELNTWFDDERKFDSLMDKLDRGIFYSSCVVVFLTSRYMDKISGKGIKKDLDEIKVEFDFCCENKSPENMIIVVMEESLKDLSQWPKGNIDKFWNHPIIDFSKSLVDIEDSGIDLLVAQIHNIVQKKKQQEQQKKLAAKTSPSKQIVATSAIESQDSFKVYGVVMPDGVYHGYVEKVVSKDVVPVPHGKGSYVYFFGESYEGDWVLGRKNGRGKLKWDDGGLYEGNFVDNERRGRGVLKDPANNIYDGEWLCNKPHGMGLQTFSNGDTYEGPFKEGKMDGGGGRYTYADSKTVYEGMFQDNQKGPRGKLIYADGANYEGEMSNNTIQGQGCFSWPNGNIFKGHFLNGRFVNGSFYLDKTNDTYVSIFTDLNEIGDGTEIGGSSNCRVYDVTLKSGGGIYKQGRFCNGEFLPSPEEIAARELVKRMAELERIRQIEEARRRRKAEADAKAAKLALDEKLKKQALWAQKEREKKAREAATRHKAREDKKQAKRLKRLAELADKEGGEGGGGAAGEGVASAAPDEESLASLEPPTLDGYDGVDMDDKSVGSLEKYSNKEGLSIRKKKRGKSRNKKRKKRPNSAGDVPKKERQYSKISLENKIADYKQRIDFDEETGEHYDGEIRTGKYHGEFWFHGHGHYQWGNGSKYTGDWHKDKMHGTGLQTWVDGTSYEGDFCYGLWHGRGVMKTSDGASFNGEFANGNRHGNGIEVWTDGSSYSGSFAVGKKHGKGSLTFADGGSYEGDWERGKRHGTGSQRWADGSSYFGDYERDLFSGNGFYTWADGTTYDGEFKAGKKEGKGKQVWLSGSSYDGYYLNDMKNGIGTFVFRNGSSYTGDFFNDKKHGNGVYKWKDGSYYDGVYVGDKKHGRGMYRWANGNNFDGIFKDNMLSTGIIFLKLDRSKYKAVFTPSEAERDADSSNVYDLELRHVDTGELYKNVQFCNGRVIYSQDEERSILAAELAQLSKDLPV